MGEILSLSCILVVFGFVVCCCGYERLLRKLFSLKCLEWALRCHIMVFDYVVSLVE